MEGFPPHRPGLDNRMEAETWRERERERMGDVERLFGQRKDGSAESQQEEDRCTRFIFLVRYGGCNIH